MKTIEVSTTIPREILDITDKVKQMIPKMFKGAVLVSVPHTTAGITVNEGADPDVKRDLLMKFSKIAEDMDYIHSEGNSASHLLSSIAGNSILLPVEEGDLIIGTWQAIYFCEFDGPRERTVNITFLKG